MIQALFRCALLFACMSLYQCGADDEVARMKEENFKRATIVVRHIEAYRDRFGVYPDSLDDVKQRLGVKLPEPVPAAVPRWYYSREGQEFELMFTTSETRKYPVWYYASADHQWHSDE